MTVPIRPPRRRRVRFAGKDLLGDQPGILPDRGFDLGGHVGIVAQEGLGVLAALADPLAVIGVIGAQVGASV